MYEHIREWCVTFYKRKLLILQAKISTKTLEKTEKIHILAVVYEIVTAVRNVQVCNWSPNVVGKRHAGSTPGTNRRRS